jgi:hypothetical protein
LRIKLYLLIHIYIKCIPWRAYILIKPKSLVVFPLCIWEVFHIKSGVSCSSVCLCFSFHLFLPFHFWCSCHFLSSMGFHKVKGVEGLTFLFRALLSFFVSCFSLYVHPFTLKKLVSEPLIGVLNLLGWNIESNSSKMINLNRTNYHKWKGKMRYMIIVRSFGFCGALLPQLIYHMLWYIQISCSFLYFYIPFLIFICLSFTLYL